MNTSTKNDIIRELNMSIVQHKCSDQRFRQLHSCLSKEDPLLVGDSLLRYWEDLVESDFRAQTFVASLLFALNPPTSFPLNHILQRLPQWNLSVEEFPWYLAVQFGEESVFHELDILERDSVDIEKIAPAARTVRWWLQGDYRSARSKYE